MMGFRFRPSRAATIALIALAAATIYFLAVLGAAALLTARGGVLEALMLFALPLLSAVAAAVLLPARRTRGWMKVMLAKHVFTHRYDYRAEWLRFNDTLGRPGPTAPPLAVRVVKAIADITDSPAGLLLGVESGGLVRRESWQWTGPEVPAYAPCDGLLTLLAEARIIALDPLRSEGGEAGSEARAIPNWLFADENAWAIVPLIHLDALAGAVVVARPAIARTLDWEDFDLLRVAGRQAASYLAEERGQEALSDAVRFDEFNRRFAFIMHDIKNLVSQLSLVARNAERHAEKPEFRADMVATLNASTARMSQLLAKLAQHEPANGGETRPTDLAPILNAVAAAKRLQHPIVIAGDTGLAAHADPQRLEAAIGHLVQNAIEASPPAEPVTLMATLEGERVRIAVIDRGSGMTPDFVSERLFRPFHSTKTGGFGIGAHEARSMIAAMGGQLAVRSEVGRGSAFTISLPVAARWNKAIAA